MVQKKAMSAKAAKLPAGPPENLYIHFCWCGCRSWTLATHNTGTHQYRLVTPRAKRGRKSR